MKGKYYKHFNKCIARTIVFQRIFKLLCIVGLISVIGNDNLINEKVYADTVGYELATEILSVSEPELYHDFEDYEPVPASINTSIFSGTNTTTSIVDYENGSEGNKVLKATPTAAGGFDMYNKSLQSLMGTNKYQVYECAIKLPAGIPDSGTAYHQIQMHRFGSDLGANTGMSYATIQNYMIRDGSAYVKKEDGTNFVFEPEQWYIVRRVMRFDVNPNIAYTSVYDMDGTLLASAEASNRGSVVLDPATQGFYTRSWRIHISGPGIYDKTVMIDNIKLYSIDPQVNLSDQTDVELCTEIEAIFTVPMKSEDITKDNIILTQDDVTVSEKLSIIHTDSEKCILQLEGLDYSSTYSLTFKRNINEASYGLPIDEKVVTINTKPDPYGVINEAVYSSESEQPLTGAPALDSNIEARASVQNTSPEDVNAVLVLTLFKDNSMKGMIAENVTIPSGQTVYITTEPIKVNEAGCRATVMVWSDWDYAEPIGDKVTVQ